MCNNIEQKKIVFGAEQKIEPKCYQESSHALIWTINNYKCFIHYSEYSLINNYISCGPTNFVLHFLNKVVYTYRALHE